MRGTKKAERVLFDIVHDIALDGLTSGDRLPSQAEMVARYGVGVTPLREALRTLEFAGLISVHPGASMGMLVEGASAERLASLVAPFLTVAGVTYGQVLDAWLATEPVMAAAAATNPDRVMVERLIASHAQASAAPSKEPVDPADAADFHDAVAQAAGNPALTLILQAVTYVLADLYWASCQRPTASDQVRHDHHAVAHAILGGDPEAARIEMARHVLAMSQVILNRSGLRREERFIWRRPPIGPPTYRHRPRARE